VLVLGLRELTWFGSIVSVIVVVESGATVSHEQAFPNPDRACSCLVFVVAAANAAALAPFAMTSDMIEFAKAN